MCCMHAVFLLPFVSVQLATYILCKQTLILLANCMSFGLDVIVHTVCSEGSRGQGRRGQRSKS